MSHCVIFNIKIFTVAWLPSKASLSNEIGQRVPKYIKEFNEKKNKLYINEHVIFIRLRNNGVKINEYNKLTDQCTFHH